MARPIVSIIISAKNEASVLRGCLDSLLAQKGKMPFEVRVVDNGSSDATYQIAKSYTAINPSDKSAGQVRFHVHRCREPGSPAARNFGAKKALGKILLFTDADCIASPTWVKEMARPFLAKLEFPLGALGGSTLSAFRDPQRPNFIERYLDYKFANHEIERTSDFPAFLPWAPTCNLAVDRKLFEALGGFRETWRVAAYDTDLCWRVQLAGFVFANTPRAKVFHHRRHSLKALWRQSRNYSYYNSLLFKDYEKYLKLSRISSKLERSQSRMRYHLREWKHTTNPRSLSFRALDSLSALAEFQGWTESLVHFSADPKPARVNLKEIPLGKPFHFLHKKGWVYWPSPVNLGLENGLTLFRPKEKVWYQMNPTAFHIWQKKFVGETTETIAKQFGIPLSDQQTHNEMDEILLDFKTRKLLP